MKNWWTLINKQVSETKKRKREAQMCLGDDSRKNKFKIGEVIT